MSLWFILVLMSIASLHLHVRFIIKSQVHLLISNHSYHPVHNTMSSSYQLELQEHPASPFLFLPSLEWSLNANQKLKVPGSFSFVPNRKSTPKSMSYSKSDLKTGPSPFSSLTSHLSFLYTLLSTDTTFDSINMPINFPPQGLSTCCSLCLEHSGPWPSAG